MQLARLMAQLDRNSYYSRSQDDILGAINDAGWLLYTAVLREHRGYFIKTDTTSITLAPNTTVYTLPADLTSLLHIAERETAGQQWNPMMPQSLGDAMDVAADAMGYTADPDYYGEPSNYSFYGPYLTQAAVTAQNQVYSITITPLVTQPTQVELVYAAKWMPVDNPASLLMLPDEAYTPLLTLATANLLDLNSDSQANIFRSRAQNVEVPAFLSWARQRQVTGSDTIQMFGE